VDRPRGALFHLQTLGVSRESSVTIRRTAITLSLRTTAWDSGFKAPSSFMAFADFIAPGSRRYGRLSLLGSFSWSALGQAWRLAVLVYGQAGW
jgi:hypothetical protein